VRRDVLLLVAMIAPSLPEVNSRGTVGRMPTKLPINKLIGFAAAVTAGFALSRFTSGDWIGGIVLTAAVAGTCAWYLLTQRRPRDTRRY
jgi:hypothetical protein